MNENDLVQQNLLLQQKKMSLEKTMKSLENENRILHEILSLNALDSCKGEEYVDNIWQDEMRNGFLVSTDRKRLWNAQIGILKEFDRICKKHNLKWFAHGVTLLGAVRHKGFVPWNLDINVAMLRPYYEKFRQVIGQELKSPYFFNAWYNHRFKSDMILNIHDSENLPLIPLKIQMAYTTLWPFYPMLRIRDSRTTLITGSDHDYMPQNAFISIVPLDPAPPFSDESLDILFEGMRFLLSSTIMPWRMTHSMNKKQHSIFSDEITQNLLRLPFRKRAITLETFMAENFFNSEYISEFKYYIFNNQHVHSDHLLQSKDFQSTVYLPFENIQIPVPAGYENVLDLTYKDWRRIKISSSLLPYCSVDIPYDEYARKSMFVNSTSTN